MILKTTEKSVLRQLMSVVSRRCRRVGVVASVSSRRCRRVGVVASVSTSLMVGTRLSKDSSRFDTDNCFSIEHILSTALKIRVFHEKPSFLLSFYVYLYFTLTYSHSFSFLFLFVSHSLFSQFFFLFPFLFCFCFSFCCSFSLRPLLTLKRVL